MRLRWTNAARRSGAAGAALAVAVLAGCGDGGGDGSDTPSTSASAAPSRTTSATPTPIQTLGAGQLIELPKDTEWIEPTDEPYRFAMPSGWDTLDIRAIAAGGAPEENTLRWAAERKVDLARIVASDARSGWSVRLLRTSGSNDNGPVAYVLARWQPGRKVANAKAAVGELKATGVQVTSRTTPLGTAFVVTGDVTIGKRRLPMARILVNTPDGLARIHLVATFPAERNVVLQTIARTISYR